MQKLRDLHSMSSEDPIPQTHDLLSHKSTIEDVETQGKLKPSKDMIAIHTPELPTIRTG